MQIVLRADPGEHAIGVKYAALNLHVSHIAFNEKRAAFVMPNVLAEDVMRGALIAVDPQITPPILAMPDLSERGFR